MNGLQPEVQNRLNQLLSLAVSQGIDLQVTSTYRPFGQIVRSVFGVRAPGASYHNFGLAFDVAPSTIPTRSVPWSLWQHIGSLGESLGLNWGGRFSRPDPIHFELRIAPIGDLLAQQFGGGIRQFVSENIPNPEEPEELRWEIPYSLNFIETDLAVGSISQYTLTVALIVLGTLIFLTVIE